MIISNLKKTYNRETQDYLAVLAINDVNLTLPETGFVVFLGKSGSGKTTLLNLIGGLDKADGGSIKVDNKDICQMNDREIEYYRNCYCGFIFQEYNLIPELDVGENIALALELQGETVDDTKINLALEKVGLSGYERRRISELSGGQKQRVAIARVLIKKPKIILADEPTAALDTKNAENIFGLLKELSKECLVIAVTHNKELAENFADRIIALSDGKVVADSNEESVENLHNCDFKAKKISLPTKTAFKLSMSNLKAKCVRFMVAVTLSVLAFSCFGTSLSGVLNSPTKIYNKAVFSSDIKYSALYKYSTYTDENFAIETLLGGSSTYFNRTTLQYSDIETIKSFTNATVVGVENKEIYSFQNCWIQSIGVLNETRKNSDLDYSVSANGFMSITQEDCEALGFAITGRLPNNENEIAINECLFHTFACLGLREREIEYVIEEKEDILGHRIPIGLLVGVGEQKTIVGVVDTGCSKGCVEGDLNGHQTGYDSYGYHEKIFVHESSIGGYTYLLIPTQKNIKEQEKLVKDIFNYSENDFVYRFENKVAKAFYEGLELVNILKTIFLYLGIIFALFAVVQLSHFITSSIQNQMLQIGILSSLGMGKKGIVKIYFILTSIIGILIWLLSCIGALIWNGMMNKFLIGEGKLAMFSFQVFLPFILIVVVSIALFLGCIFPILKIRKDTPAEIIKNGIIK